MEFEFAAPPSREFEVREGGWVAPHVARFGISSKLSGATVSSRYNMLAKDDGLLPLQPPRIRLTR